MVSEMVEESPETGDAGGTAGGGARAADATREGGGEVRAGDRDAVAISRLEAIVAAAGGAARPAPVERWDPPYCGDIGLAILADGTWFYRGSPIRRPALVKLFASVLRRDADGRHYLVTPAEKVDVTVADAPFLAVEMEVLDAGAGQTIVVRTSLDDVVRVSAENPLRLTTGADGGFKPYVLVRGRLEAVFTRALAFDLAGLLVEADDACHGPGVWSGGAFFALDVEAAMEREV